MGKVARKSGFSALGVAAAVPGEVVDRRSAAPGQTRYRSYFTSTKSALESTAEVAELPAKE